MQRKKFYFKKKNLYFFKKFYEDLVWNLVQKVDIEIK